MFFVVACCNFSNTFYGPLGPGPHENLRKDWPRVRQQVKAGNTYFSVDLRRKHYHGPKWKNFTSRDKSLEYASEIGKKVAKPGIYSIQTSQGDDRLKAWGEQCAVYGKTVEQAGKGDRSVARVCES